MLASSNRGALRQDEYDAISRDEQPEDHPKNEALFHTQGIVPGRR